MELLFLPSCTRKKLKTLYPERIWYRYQFDIKITEVEYLPLVYCATYDYYYGTSIQELEYTISKGSWSLDFFELSIIIMVITDLVWISFERQQKKESYAETQG